MPASSVDLYCRELGAGSAPPVLLVHGLGDSGDTWSEFAGRLDASRPILIPDLRGHGRSPFVESYAVDDLARDLVALLDARAIEQIDLVGHSLGATVAYRMASLVTSRIRRLVLEEPPPPVPADPPRDAGPRPPGELGFDWRIQDQFSAQRNDPPAHWLADASRISAPTLILRGRRSHIRSEQVAELVAAIPDCTLVELDAGHDIHADLPDAFADAATAFLAPAS